jgi:hypothetical protein
MVSRCANPECESKFRYLNQGKLYILRSPRAEVRAEGDDAQNLIRRLLWLCERCSERLVVVQGPEGVPQLAPRAKSRAAAA